MDLPRKQKQQKRILEDDLLITKEGQLIEKSQEEEFLLAEKASVLLTWQGPEYEHYPKEKRWYLGITIALALIILYALITNSPIMAITFILIGIVGYIYLEKPPRVLDFKLTHSGVMVGSEMYRYEGIKSFWIFYEPPHTKILSLRTNSFFVPYIHIPIHQKDPVEIRELLLDFIPEMKQDPSLVNTLERLLHV